MTCKWAKEVLSDVEKLSEERVELVLNKYLEDFRDGALKTNGWPTYIGPSTYMLSKAAMNAYTRILAKNYPTFCINCVHPGFVKTDMTGSNGFSTPAQGAENVVRVALLPIGASSGLYYNCQQMQPRPTKLKHANQTGFDCTTAAVLILVPTCYETAKQPKFPALISKKYAVVTGANKGIGLAICKLLASKGVMVVLTARDEKRGLEALEKLKESGLSDHLVFHRLDVADPATITCLANFVKNRFGKLDILVNNAGIGGSTMNHEALKAAKVSGTEADVEAVWSKVLIETYELAEECLKINYYGAKTTAEALIPLLQLSDSPRIVNISSSMGKLQYIPSEQRKEALRDADTGEKIDELITEFLKDFKEGSLESKGWPTFLSAYTISKVAMNAYTRILAKKHPNFCINCVCPGFVKTDINNNTGHSTPEEGAAIPVKLALWPNGGAPSGLFFVQGEPIPFE
ncbi:hypothetical protein Gogos_016796 [Gossypium gossypioides]|uniref:(+)-neomenthol dehydrogenase n=2 Tax=Gossypium gossypioides TaxID=34282 RepID=A0A7J9BAU2_GOSGO|nr:hypothetical protein [Gossypium gossypioides]